LLMASYDTTAVAVTFTIWLLSQHLSVQSDLARAIVAQAGRPGGGSLLKPVLNESMRLFPPVWGIGREAVVDIEVGGYLVPAGTQVLTLPYIMHHDPNHFDEPDVFRPERFADNSKKWSAYFPFGVGPQACMGAQFATIESLVTISHLLERYEFRDQTADKLGCTLGITLRPTTDIVVAVEKRAPLGISVSNQDALSKHGYAAVTAVPDAASVHP
jgi:cytochrome P450